VSGRRRALRHPATPRAPLLRLFRVRAPLTTHPPPHPALSLFLSRFRCSLAFHSRRGRGRGGPARSPARAAAHRGKYNPDDEASETLVINFGRDNIELQPGCNVFRVIGELTAIKGCPQKTRLICEQIHGALSQNLAYRPTWQKQLVAQLGSGMIDE